MQSPIIASEAMKEKYLHPTDKKALEALNKIPFFDKVCSKFIAWCQEPFYNVIDRSSKVRISEKQLPKLYAMLTDICQKLAIEVPEFYLVLNRFPNAYTYGNEHPSVTITSGLLEIMNEDEIYCVIAHECGHIACNHVLYTTMAEILFMGGSIGAESVLGSNLFTKAILAPIKLALAHWYRCGELSADRAAAVCCGSADEVVSTMAKLAGGVSGGEYAIDYAVFAEQAKDYKEMLDDSKLNKLIEYSQIFSSTHPLLAVRANEIRDWTTTDDFKSIAYPKRKGKSKLKEDESLKKKKRGLFGLLRRKDK